jgi:hypothetical protein
MQFIAVYAEWSQCRDLYLLGKTNLCLYKLWNSHATSKNRKSTIRGISFRYVQRASPDLSQRNTLERSGVGLIFGLA